MDNVKPRWPSCEGNQYASDVEGNYVHVSYDSNGNEIPEGGDFHHTGSTPGNGSANYSADHYADDFRGKGNAPSYGVSVDAGGVSRNDMSVRGDAADRGKES